MHTCRPLLPAAVLVAAGLASGCGVPVADGGPRLHILGTVQDGGFPHVACTCTRCEAARADPKLARAVASVGIVLPQSGKRYLIDATPDLGSQLARLLEDSRSLEQVDRAPLDGVFLTHAHLGHYTGLVFFGYEAVSSDGLPVYCTPAMAEMLRANAPWSRLLEGGHIEIRLLQPGRPVMLEDGVSVTAFTVPHRDELSDTVGFRVQGARATVVYVPDTDTWTTWAPPLSQVLDGVDVALLDGTFFSRDELPDRNIAVIGHPLIRETMDLLQPLVGSSGIRVHFTHLNHSNPALDPSGPERREIEARGFQILAEDLIIPL